MRAATQSIAYNINENTHYIYIVHNNIMEAIEDRIQINPNLIFFLQFLSRLTQE